MATKYVKFLRGTPQAYKNLAVKDSDTLYFIYEEDESSAELYLGSKLIAGSLDGTVSASSFLSELKDVFISENLLDSSFLVYDASSSKWINKSIDQLFFVGATDLSSGIGGLVPAPEVGQTDLFLKSDGTWASPEVNHIVLTLENPSGATHAIVIADATEGFTNTSGDIIIIKDLIADDKWQYTAYVYDNNEWHAMDGNYNAENVYFSEDLITTTAIGNITLTNGQATIAAAGKNLKQVFQTIFVDEKDPTTTQPSVAITLSKAGDYEVGTEVETSYSARLKSGSYTYGPPTNVVANTWSVSDGTNTKDTASGAFDNIIVGDATNYTLTATATYGDGAIPVTNLGNPYSSGQILASSATGTSSAIKGHRKSFYGSREEKNDLTSELIRNLNATEGMLSANSEIKVNVAVNALSVVFAYPATLPDLVSVTDTNAMGSEILSSFTQEIIAVNGANNYEPCNYKVYTIKFANPYDTSNYYTFTIGEEAEA